MKSKEDLNKEILETLAHIQKHYPELTKFEDEMTITIPSDLKTEITANNLLKYYLSLQAMARGYSICATK